MTVKAWARAAISRYPALSRPLWRAIYPLLRKDERYAGLEYAGGRTEAFTLIYAENRWQDGESVSGSGSTLQSTKMLQASLEKAIKKTGAHTLLDAPCGDFNWMQRIRFQTEVKYIGGEIVVELADKLQADYGSADRRFVTLDIVEDELPAADLWLCRHVLMHLSNADVLRLLRNFVRSEIAYFLADNYGFEDRNADIASGGYRFINLRRPPFNLPAPLARYPNSNPPSPPDYLCLWSREQVIRALNT